MNKYNVMITNTDLFSRSEHFGLAPQGTKHTFLDKKKGINKLHRDSILS